MNTLLTLFFDITANGGWNLTAWLVWAGMIGMPILAIIERKHNSKGI
jgi:hypothetical protein